MCPPGVDQTTRMEQYWNLVAPKLKQKLSLSSDKPRWHRGHDTMYEFLSEEWSFGAFEKLARIPFPELETHLSSRAVQKRLSPLESLPSELTTMILSNDRFSKADILAFGSCSQSLWIQTLAFIRSNVRKTAAPWARSPLICVGNYLTDLPPVMHDLYPDVRPAHARWQANVYGPCPARFWGAEIVHDATDPVDARREWREAFVGGIPNLVPFTNAQRRELDQALASSPPALDGKWILQDLNNNETVQLQASATAEHETTITVAGAPWLSLDMALLLRICWTDTDSYEYYASETLGPLKFVGGKWAGHSFEIKQLPEGKESDTKDVTTSIILEAQYFDLHQMQGKQKVDYWAELQNAESIPLDD